MSGSDRASRDFSQRALDVVREATRDPEEEAPEGDGAPLVAVSKAAKGATPERTDRDSDGGSDAH